MQFQKKECKQDALLNSKEFEHECKKLTDEKNHLEENIHSLEEKQQEIKQEIKKLDNHFSNLEIEFYTQEQQCTDAIEVLFNKIIALHQRENKLMNELSGEEEKSTNITVKLKEMFTKQRKFVHLNMGTNKETPSMPIDNQFEKTKQFPDLQKIEEKKIENLDEIRQQIVELQNEKAKTMIISPNYHVNMQN